MRYPEDECGCGHTADSHEQSAWAPCEVVGCKCKAWGWVGDDPREHDDEGDADG